MNANIKNGIWATMITPFTLDDKIDYNALERLLYWYRDAGIDGVFALCYSSEILKLSQDEAKQLLRYILRILPRDMGIVASVHGSSDIDEQIERVKGVRDIGCETAVLVGNRLAAPGESDDAVFARIERILSAVPDVSFGVYECPYPYKYYFSAALIGRLAQTGRFAFMKETSCDANLIEAKIKSTANTQFRIFNANSATLLDSLNRGAAGFCGIMCNFHPDLYAELYRAFLAGEMDRARKIQALLGVLSVYEHQYYPVNAKAYLEAEGLGVSTVSRLQDRNGLTYGMRVELDEMRELTQMARDLLGKA